MSVRIWSRQRGFIPMLIVAAVALGVCGLSALADEPEPVGEVRVTVSPSGTKIISLDTRGSSITDLLRVIGMAGGADIIIGPGVEGYIPALTLTDVTVEEALDYLEDAGYIQWHERGDAYIVIVTAEGPSIISVKVALLSELAPLADPQDYHSRIRQVLEGPFYSGMPPQVTGDRIIHDPNAGLVTIINPDDRLWLRLFRPALLGYGTGGRRPGSLAVEHGSVKVGEERSFDLVWPPGRPQYYLEKVEQDVYHRVAVADKEGYTVTVRPTGAAPDLTVALELARNTFTRGKYDETIRAFVGQPSLLKTILTSQAPLTSGQQTLLVWLPRPEAQVVAPVAGAAPSWTVGEWEMTGPGDGTGVLTVKADGTVIWHIDLDNGRMMAEPGSVDSSGQVHARLSLTGEHWTILSGELAPDGTASGRISPQSMTWTAIRVQAPGIERAAPAWAVGEWEMKVPGEDARPALIVVQPNGDVLIEDHPYALTRGDPKPSGTLSPWGQLQYRVFSDYFLLLRMAGKLNPDGTGSGSGYAKKPDNRFTWTATKVPGPETQQGAPPWAVGQWQLTTSRGFSLPTNVLPNGTVVGEGPPHGIDKGMIDPSGQIQCGVTYDGRVGVMTGRLTPEGTGGGTIRQEGAPPDSVPYFGAFWTAKQTLQPIPHAEPPVTELPAPDAVRAVVPIPPAAPGPVGVAVLLEIGPADEAPLIPGQ